MNKCLSFIKNHFNFLLIGILICIVLLQRSCNPSTIKGEVTTTYDTIWKTKVDTITKKVTVYKTIHTKIPDSLKASLNCDTLRSQYNDLVIDYTDQNIFKDTLLIDDIGIVVINDTIQYNKLKTRQYISNYKIPTVIKTITTTTPPKLQVYFGGDVLVSKGLIAAPGLLLKSKSDQIYKINVGMDNQGNTYFGGGLYWKLKF